MIFAAAGYPVGDREVPCDRACPLNLGSPRGAIRANRRNPYRESTSASLAARPRPGVVSLPWLGATRMRQYARHTRNATVFIVWLLGIGTAIGIILGILAVIDLGGGSGRRRRLPP